VPNVSKHDLIVDVSKSTGLTQADTNVIVKELLEIISEFLERDEIIELRGFGTFYRKMRKPRLTSQSKARRGCSPAQTPRTALQIFKRVEGFHFCDLESISKPRLHSAGYGCSQASSGCFAISLFDIIASPSSSPPPFPTNSAGDTLRFTAIAYPAASGINL
jgi:nucleoid DNA-binding protein